MNTFFIKSVSTSSASFQGDDLKIGYIPYSHDLSVPGDRRRFPYFAKRHNLQFEIAELNKEYDIIKGRVLSLEKDIKLDISKDVSKINN